MPALTLNVPVPTARRLPELDELKGLAIILVIIYHAGGVLSWGNRIHGDLGVDIFVILSGMGLALGSSYPGFWPFLRRRLLRIMPTYWVVLTVAVVANTHFLQLKFGGLNIFLHYLGIHGWFGDSYALTICDSFWFITLILSLYLFFTALQRWMPSPVKLLLAGSIISVTVALVLFYTNQSGSFGHMALRLPGFFLGLVLGQLMRHGRLDLAVGPLLALALFIVVFVPYSQGIIFHSILPGLSFMGVYVYVLRPFAVRSIPAAPRTLAFLGDHSLEIFLIHQPLIREYNLYLHGRWFNVPVPSTLSLFVGVLAGLAVTVLVSIELRRLLKRLLPA